MEKSIWIYIDTAQETMRNVSRELLGAGRILADQAGMKLAGVMIGQDRQDIAKEVWACGADKLYAINSKALVEYSSEGYSQALISLLKEHNPAAMLFGASSDGKELAGRCAIGINGGITANCTGMDWDKNAKNFVWSSNSFGGRFVSTSVCDNTGPQIVTVRASVFNKPSPDYSRGGEVISCDPKIECGDIHTKIMELLPSTTSDVNLEEADIVVSGGRGMGNKENFSLLEELAEALGGAVGASRAAVEEGWQTQVHQVGQTGKNVRPKIYIACGISGAIQHIAGMSSSDIIIAINKDAAAPIFKISDYGVVADAMEFIPSFIAALRKAKLQ